MSFHLIPTSQNTSIKLSIIYSASSPFTGYRTFLLNNPMPKGFSGRKKAEDMHKMQDGLRTHNITSYLHSYVSSWVGSWELIGWE